MKIGAFFLENSWLSTNTTANSQQDSLFGNLSRQDFAGILVIIISLALAVWFTTKESALSALWLLGIATGFTLQRSRFCFASAFRDLFLFGSGRTMKGILLAITITTIGFAVVMHNFIPDTSYGYLPEQARVFPMGVSTVVAGLIFGFGMVLAGGCVSGSLYRIAEGYTASWVTIGGILIGLGLLSHTWNWWWETVISTQPQVWLPNLPNMSYGSSLAITGILLFSVFLLVIWWESKTGLAFPAPSESTSPHDTVRDKLTALWNKIFAGPGWNAITGGTLLGGIGILMYMVHMPWGVTGELNRLSLAIMSSLQISPPAMLGMSGMGCSAEAGGGLFSHTFATTVGLIAGSLVASLFSKEFKIRTPTNPVRYVQSLGGGILMGYGAGLGLGCTVGAFLSSISSLSLGGWLFGLALAAGAFVGVQAIKRIA